MIVSILWITISAVLTFSGLILFSIHRQGDILNVDMDLIYTDYLIGVIGLCGFMSYCIYGMTFGARRFF